MMLLALDTSTRMLGLALFDGRQVLAECTWQGKGHHTQELAPEIALLLRRAGVLLDEVQAVGIATGPGSFTGLRIGMALAKGLCLSGGRALVGIPTLDILARAQPRQDGRLFVAIQAGRGRIVGMWYKWSRKGWRPEADLQVLTWEMLAAGVKPGSLICGEIDGEARRLLESAGNIRVAPPVECVRRPGWLASMAWELWRAGKTADPAKLAPIYIHTEGGRDT